MVIYLSIHNSAETEFT